ncbi:MAG: prepilin-type N-terminal cleavage/methylation domain-containing protein [Deltaproteobacteria bacterium]
MSITKCNLKSSKGFTLIELLIVILILSLLVAIVLPIYTSKNEKARQTANASNIAAIEAAADNYDLEVGLAAGDYEKIDNTSTIFTKGYLKSVPVNPWAKTTKTQGGDAWGYILVKYKASADATGNVTNPVNKVFLGSLNDGVTPNVITYYDPVADTATSTINCVSVITGATGLTGADNNHQYFVTDPTP